MLTIVLSTLEPCDGRRSPEPAVRARDYSVSGSAEQREVDLPGAILAHDAKPQISQSLGVERPTVLDIYERLGREDPPHRPPRCRQQPRLVGRIDEGKGEGRVREPPKHGK